MCSAHRWERDDKKHLVLPSFPRAGLPLLTEAVFPLPHGVRSRAVVDAHCPLLLLRLGRSARPGLKGARGVVGEGRDQEEARNVGV